MIVVLVIIIKILIFRDPNRIKRIIISKCFCAFDWINYLIRNVKAKKEISTYFLLFTYYSQGNSNNDHWNGFDNDFENSSYQSADNQDTSNTRKATRTEKTITTEKGDFSALDVKASKPTKTNKAKSIEDDAWNLLNNWIFMGPATTHPNK